MVLVYIPGVWDLLHVGHVVVLERAKALGDRLVVGVPSDRIVLDDKGSAPVMSLEHRVKMLQSLRCVDLAIPYYDLSFIDHLNSFDPDILVVGTDWGMENRHRQAEQWIYDHGKRMIVLPRTPMISTTEIKRTILEQRK